MTLLEAVFARHSVRAYLPEPLTPDQRRQLEKAVEQCCRRSGLHLQLICGRPEPFASLRNSYGLLKGVHSYLVFAGPAEDPDLEEKCGYWGEELVLTASAMGLGTCWVGGTYDRESCLCHLGEGERLVCVAAVGPARSSLRSELIGRAAKRKTRTAAELSVGLEGAPAWFRAGMEAVVRAPSALNRQGYRFTFRPDGTVRAESTVQGEFSGVDLGIAMYHFQLGAHGGTWEDGVFRKAREEKSCGAVIWREEAGRRAYLLARHNGGHWSFPKGHVEGDETETGTAAREILEETGLTASIDTGFRRVVTYAPAPGVVKDVVFFTAVPTGGREHPQEEEIAQLGWFSLAEAAERITYASDLDILLAADAYLEGRGQAE